MTTRIGSWAAVSLLGCLVGVGAVHCGGDEAETGTPPGTVGSAGKAGAGGAAGKAGAAGSTAGTGGATAGAGGSAAGAGGSTAGAGGSTAGAGGSTAGAGGSTAGAGGSTAGAGGSTAGAGGSTAGAGGGGTNAGGAAGSTGGAGGETGGAGAANAGAGGEAGAAGAAGAAGSGGAAGGLSYPFSDDVTKNPVWLESDRFVKPPANLPSSVEKWLDQGTYVSTAEVGLYAIDPAFYPKLVNIGPTSAHPAIQLEKSGLSFQKYAWRQKLDQGFSLFAHLAPQDANPYQPIFDCGTKADTDDLGSLEDRVYFGRDGSNGLQYSVFDATGAIKGSVSAADVFGSPSTFATLGVTHENGKAILWVNGVSVGVGSVPMPSKVARQQCFLGRSLLRNKPGNSDLFAHVRAVYAFSNGLSSADHASLQAYITKRWTP